MAGYGVWWALVALHWMALSMIGRFVIKTADGSTALAGGLHGHCLPRGDKRCVSDYHDAFAIVCT
jgi:hypothetical protein